MAILGLQGVRGGTGVTSITAALAWALQLLGESVLAIDASPDNMLRFFFNTDIHHQDGWARALLDGRDWRDAGLRYTQHIDLLPFGQLSAGERENVDQLQPTLGAIAEAVQQLQGQYRWLLLDLPAGYSPLTRELLTLCDRSLVVVHPDANSHIRLHQQPLPANGDILINDLRVGSQLQEDLYQLWLESQPRILPVTIHRDEAMAECLAAKQPLGEYRQDSLAALEGVHGRYTQWLEKLPEQMNARTGHLDKQKELAHLNPKLRRAILGGVTFCSLVLALMCITQPFNPLSQFIFLMLLWGVALLVRRIPGRFSALMLIVLSLTVSCRYIWWRYTSTLNWNDPVSLVCGIILLFAETYAWVVLVLGYFQVVWPLNRQPVPLPEDMDLWPTVDIFVPTYNEDLNVVKNTIYASQGIDWPKDKLNIWILDDGGREAFRQFAKDVGVHYIARTSHEHAKAGNINNALKYAKGEFVSIFDCDHVPTRSFLQMTMGWFLKEKELAMMQTPHHFFSPDPFERNLGRFRKTPNEGTLFYGLVQDGNDMWDATFFCGSCAVIRRGPLDEIGGIAVETVTEDAHTSLRLHRRGYTSAYMRIPQAAGLATESLSAHIGQRIRWARGMVQIFRLDNPLFGKGLKLVQRVCYANAMLHFLSGIPRLIFLTAPLAFLLLHAYIIYAPALMIALFVLPHMIHASLTNSKIQGKYRHSFWSEIYETVLAWYIAPPTFVALINPHKGKFNVTAKGGLVEEEYVDWVISRPYIYLVLLNLVGVAVGIWRFMYGPENEILTVWVSIVWVFYNLIILGGAVAVSVESKQVRRSHRVEMSMPAAIAREDGHLFSCTVHDYSDGGLGIKINGDAQVLEGQNARLLLKRGQQEYAFPVRVARVNGSEVGLQLLPLTNQQHIDFVQCTFARADTWALWQDSFPEDKPMESLLDILKLGFRGYRHLAEFSPPSVKVVFRALTSLVAWIASFVPRRPERAAPTLSADPAMAQQ
ncbi:UDP-forming cellulose synthase catalytic subunit [Klebsiella pneumoniae]|nr:UDP-forming cellulose synthase catalytic subunit [Klebsiella pneumoniae]MEB7443051.1 UDP-forming cellulose synthase catalytic subunit [Klebsiella pneumoniae]